MNNPAQAVTNGQGYALSGGVDYNSLKTIDLTGIRREIDISKVSYDECAAHDLLAKNSYSILMDSVFKHGIMPHHRVKYGRVGRRVFIKEICEGTHTVWHSTGTSIYTVKEK
jgi:hypothetical protein